MATFVRDPEPIELQQLREYRERLDGKYKPVERSALIELGPAEQVEQLTWP